MILFDNFVIRIHGNTFEQMRKHTISSWRLGPDLAISYDIWGDVKQPIMWQISRMDRTSLVCIWQEGRIVKDTFEYRSIL